MIRPWPNRPPARYPRVSKVSHHRHRQRAGRFHSFLKNVQVEDLMYHYHCFSNPCPVCHTCSLRAPEESPTSHQNKIADLRSSSQVVLQKTTNTSAHPQPDVCRRPGASILHTRHAAHSSTSTVWSICAARPHRLWHSPPCLSSKAVEMRARGLWYEAFSRTATIYIVVRCGL